jgi:hypothetical protein
LESKNIAVPAYVAEGENARSDASVYSAVRVPSATAGGCGAAAGGAGVSFGAGTGAAAGRGVEALSAGSLCFGLDAAGAEADSERPGGTLDTSLERPEIEIPGD